MNAFHFTTQPLLQITCPLVRCCLLPLFAKINDLDSKSTYARLVQTIFAPLIPVRASPDMERTCSKSILFLTTEDPTTIKPASYQNAKLPQALRNRGAVVSIKSWLDSTLDAQALASYDAITFLWCNDYHLQPREFKAFITEKLISAQKESKSLNVVNESNVVVWNTDKRYLHDLDAAGFVVPKTKFVADLSPFNTPKALRKHIVEFAAELPNKGPIVIKPSISASSHQTHLLHDPINLKHEDLIFLKSLLEQGVQGSLMLQAFEPGIVNGEYSLIFISGKRTHTMLKVPVKGEFRCQEEFGSNVQEISEPEVPTSAKDTANKVMLWLEENIGNAYYCRVDGIMKDDGNFVLMELELIEPELYLHHDGDSHDIDLLYDALLGTTKCLIH